MKLFVLGATGGTGRAVVAHALARGHEVTAFVRSPEQLPENDRLVRRKGDPRRADDLRAALEVHHVVISALGRRDKTDPTLLADCARSLLDAMGSAGATRLLVVSSALLFPDIGWLGSFLRRFVFASGLADSRAMEDLIAESDIDWTIVRPPRLVDDLPSRPPRAENDHLPSGSQKIARAALGAFLVGEAERGEHVRRVVGVSG